MYFIIFVIVTKKNCVETNMKIENQLPTTPLQEFYLEILRQTLTQQLKQTSINNFIWHNGPI